MPLYALDDSGQPVRVLEGGPRRASCADCGATMRARAGSVRIWHWAHFASNAHCEAARETGWHLTWKALGLDGTQEIVVGRRRADVLAPGGFAVEFQASALDVGEVRVRENDWAAQGGMAWVFRADRQSAAGNIETGESFASYEENLVKPENRATLDITWRWAPEWVRAARAPSFLDIGGGELLFIGGWRPGSSPLTGYGWCVSKDWVVRNLLRGSTIPAPLAADPADIRYRIEAWLREKQQERRLEQLRKIAARHRAPGPASAAQAGGAKERGWVSPLEVLRELENLLEEGMPGLPGSWEPELRPLRGDLPAVRAVWARAVRACGGGLPSVAAVRQARQEHEQEIRGTGSAS